MRISKLCLAFFIGLLIGLLFGIDINNRFSIYQKKNHKQTLEDRYIDNQIWNVLIATLVLAKAEKKSIDEIVSIHETTLRGAFLTLVYLHKTGYYDRKTDDIRKQLKYAKKFMADRPNQFLDVKCVAVPSDGIQMDNPDCFSGSTEATKQMRKQLQEAFDYVDSLDKIK